MSLKAALDALKATKPRTFKEWLRSADADERAMVEAAIADHSIPASGLALTLRANDVPITQKTVEDMRRDTRS